MHLKTVLDGIVSSIAFGEMNENDLVMMKLVMGTKGISEVLSDELAAFLLYKLTILMMSRDGKSRNVRVLCGVYCSMLPPSCLSSRVRVSPTCTSLSPSSSLSTHTSSSRHTIPHSLSSIFSPHPLTTPANSLFSTTLSKHPLMHCNPSISNPSHPTLNQTGRRSLRSSHASGSTATETSCTRAPQLSGCSSSRAGMATATPFSTGSA